MAKKVVSLPIPESQTLSDAEILGRFIRAARTQSGMGIHEAAAFCGVAVSTMSKLERANGDVRLSSILQVCRMLGVTLTIAAGDSP
jgi:transcriptional regulator with XRE-family HTH domain